MGGCTPGCSTAGARAACGIGGAPLRPCLPLGPAPFPWAPRQSPPLIRHGSPGPARPPLPGPCAPPGRWPLGCSPCRAWSHPGSSAALPRSTGRRVRPRAPLRAAPRHRGWVGGVAWGTSFPRCSGPASTRGRGRAHCPSAAWFPRARCPRGALGLSPGQRPHPRPPGGGVSIAASESQRPDDLVLRFKRRRSGACFPWGRGLRNCCVAVPKSRGWAADLLWLSRVPRLLHVPWAWWAVGWRARALAPRASAEHRSSGFAGRSLARWGVRRSPCCPCVPGTGGMGTQAPQRALLLAVVARCGGGGRVYPGGGALRRC